MNLLALPKAKLWKTFQIDIKKPLQHSFHISQWIIKGGVLTLTAQLSLHTHPCHPTPDTFKRQVHAKMPWFSQGNKQGTKYQATSCLKSNTVPIDPLAPFSVQISMCFLKWSCIWHVGVTSAGSSLLSFWSEQNLSQQQADVQDHSQELGAG